MRPMIKLIPMFVMGLMTFILPNVSHAQLTCTDPPPPFDNPSVLENWQTVWNLTDVCLYQENVFREVISGGVGRDGIPPIDNPTFDDQATADLWLQSQSPVVFSRS